MEDGIGFEGDVVALVGALVEVVATGVSIEVQEYQLVPVNLTAT
jgi:hypothetical protein